MPENHHTAGAARRAAIRKPKPVSEGSKPRGRPRAKERTVNVQFKLLKKTAKKLRAQVRPYRRSQFAEVAISEALKTGQKKMKSGLATPPDAMQNCMQPAVKE